MTYFARLAGAFIVTVSASALHAQTSIPSSRPADRPIENLFEAAVSTSARVTASVRPELRGTPPAGQAQVALEVAGSQAGFEAWVRAFRPRAMAAGISPQTLDAAFRGVRFDQDVIRLDRNQSEFSKTIWEYLGSAVSNRRVSNGRSALVKHGTALTAIERRYGVEKEVVVAVWGLETGYGGFRGANNVIQSTATLAYEGRRSEFFEAQLIAALQILEAGDTSPRNMIGSWAGAMGHTQFMPTSYLDRAVDFDGDGRRDIWSENPTDALASTAAYLKNAGWTKGQPWGVEVILPAGFDYTQADRKTKKTAGAWARQGVRDTAGRKVPNYGRASILLPAGARGAAFMIFDNFAAIERYNPADAYVIGVGHLSDRIGGAGPIRASWPVSDRALSFSERKELQQRLTRAGFDTNGVDGRVGPNTINAIRSYQISRGLLPDGYASVTLLKQLR
ncbi:MAG: lytic murein transglycosylase [Pseudomonadota bacterium]